MSLVYRVITCNVLPAKKESFACRCEALKYIKKEIDGASKDLDRMDVLQSIRMYRIDPDVLPQHEKLFA